MKRQNHAAIFFLSSIFSLITLSFTFAEESITITTYYPSPYGSYNNLTTGNLTVSNNVTLATTSGGRVGIGTTSPAAKLDVNGTISGFGIVPIGSIIAWHKSFANTPALPAGWVECNGQVLSDSNSPYNGQTIPNLNGTGRFLRGSNTSGTLQAEDLKSHFHRYGVSHLSPYTPSGGESPMDNAYGTEFNTEATGGSETRPINMAVVWIMRVK